MRMLLLVAALLLTLPRDGLAAPCVIGTLQNYLDLPAGGCQIGGLTVDNFDNWAISLATPIDNDLVEIVPGSASLSFHLNEDAGPAFLQSRFFFTVAGGNPAAATLSLSGAAASGDGVVSSTVDICDDFPSNEPTNCLADHAILSVLQSELISDLGITQPLLVSSFFDVFVEISIDGAGTGSAALQGDTTLQFQAVPEPATLALVVSGLAACLARRRRTRRLRSARLPRTRDRNVQ
jgi:hypothetical protein